MRKLADALNMSGAQLAVLSLVYILVVATAGSVFAGRFEKSATFTKKIQPKELDRELRRMAQAIDINGAETDSIKADLDTIAILHESVFQAVDTTGGQTIADDDSAYINLDKEVLEGSIYVHAADDYAVAVNQTGTYEVSYNVCATASTSSTTGLITVLCRYASGAWLNVQGTLMTNGCTDVLDGANSATTKISLTSGDSLAVKMKHNGLGSADILTVADGVGLTIKRLY